VPDEPGPSTLPLDLRSGQLLGQDLQEAGAPAQDDRLLDQVLRAQDLLRSIHHNPSLSVCTWDERTTLWVTDAPQPAPLSFALSLPSPDAPDRLLVVTVLAAPGRVTLSPRLNIQQVLLGTVASRPPEPDDTPLQNGLIAWPTETPQCYRFRPEPDALPTAADLERAGLFALIDHPASWPRPFHRTRLTRRRRGVYSALITAALGADVLLGTQTLRLASPDSLLNVLTLLPISTVLAAGAAGLYRLRPTDPLEHTRALTDLTQARTAFSLKQGEARLALLEAELGAELERQEQAHRQAVKHHRNQSRDAAHRDRADGVPTRTGPSRTPGLLGRLFRPRDSSAPAAEPLAAGAAEQEPRWSDRRPAQAVWFKDALHRTLTLGEEMSVHGERPDIKEQGRQLLRARHTLIRLSAVVDGPIWQDEHLNARLADVLGRAEALRDEERQARERVLRTDLDRHLEVPERHDF